MLGVGGSQGVEREATSIAATADRTAPFRGRGSQPTRTVTPKIPMTIPKSFLAVMASPIHTAATIAVNITVVEFSMAAREAVKYISAAEMSEKGTAD